MSLYHKTFYTEELTTLFSDSQYVTYMLLVEKVLAEAQAKCKIIPDEAAIIIAHCCQIQFIDLDKLINDIHLGGNAAIPLVQQLTRGVKNQHFEASKYVHLGATSQDIIDTATVLMIKDYIQWLQGELKDLLDVLVRVTKKHRDTLMIGRTLLQHARPITFGLKTAGWLSSIAHTQARVLQCSPRVLKIQMFGAVGGGHRYLTNAVVEEMATALGINPDAPWQTNRDSIAEWASVLGILSGTLGKIAKDISMMMQTEVGEVQEGAKEGKGVSSTMPHKRNPVSCAFILANSTRTTHLVASILSSMTQEHERSAGLWHAEWEVLAQLMALTAGSVSATIELIDHLEVNTDRMKTNLELTKGLIYAEEIALALANNIGRMQAHDIVHKACMLAIKQDKHLKDVLLATHGDLMNTIPLDKLFNPAYSKGYGGEIIDAILKKQNYK